MRLDGGGKMCGLLFMRVRSRTNHLERYFELYYGLRQVSSGPETDDTFRKKVEG